jgi:hypothetical protein
MLGFEVRVLDGDWAGVMGSVVDGMLDYYELRVTIVTRMISQ